MHFPGMMNIGLRFNSLICVCLCNQCVKFWRSRCVLLPSHTSTLRQLSESGYQGNLDVFDGLESSSNHSLVEGFLRFFEGLNRRRSRRKLPSGGSRSQVLLVIWLLYIPAQFIVHKLYEINVMCLIFLCVQQKQKKLCHFCGPQGRGIGVSLYMMTSWTSKWEKSNNNKTGPKGGCLNPPNTPRPLRTCLGTAIVIHIIQDVLFRAVKYCMFV